MRLFLLVLAVAASVAASTHFVVTPDDAVLANYLEKAYSYYTGKGLAPLPPCSGDKYLVYVNASAQYPGATYFGNGCVLKQEFRPGYTERLAFHEVAHMFFARFHNIFDYFWIDEATPEAMASVATKVYYFPPMYFSDGLYEKNPFSLGEDRVYDWYKYSAPLAWYLERAQQWDGVLAALSTGQGAAKMYVGFLLALAGGVELGGVVYKPRYRQVEVGPGAAYDYPDVEGYSAVYYNISAPPGGFLRIEISGGGAGSVVSNVALGRDVSLANGTLLVALVNNSSNTARLRVAFYYSVLKARAVDGVYYSGNVTVRIYAEYGFQRAVGAGRINGTVVDFREGFASYTFSGGLRPYVLRVEYNGSWAYVYLNLTEFGLEVSPKTLYLGRGGYGVLNVTVVNPNPIDVRCVLNGSGHGVEIRPVEIYVPRNTSIVAGVPFRAVADPAGFVAVRCGEVVGAVQLSQPAYSLDYDLDKGRGVLLVKYGSEESLYDVAELPANVSLSYRGYVAAVVNVPRPVLDVAFLPRRFENESVVYQVNITLSGVPPWARFRGTVSITADGREKRGNYTGGPYVTEITLRPGAKATVSVSVGMLRREFPIDVPMVNATLELVRVVVRGGVASIWAMVKFDMEVRDDIPIKFLDPRPLGEARFDGGYIFLNYTYSDVVVIRYAVAGEEKSAYVELPRPRLSVELINGVVTPSEFRGLFKVVVDVCNPSVDALYVVRVNGTDVTLKVAKGGCASNSTVISARARYSTDISFSFVTSFGTFDKHLHVPPPAVNATLLQWRISGSREAASVLLRVTTQNYTYIIFNKEVSGSAEFIEEVEVSNGVAVINYGFGVVQIRRPQLGILARPVAAEVGTPFVLNVTIRAPENLYIDAPLNTSLNVSKLVSVGPGTQEFSLAVPGVSSPGFYNVSISLGPYVNYTTLLVYRVNVTISAPSLAPVGAPVNITVIGHVYPSIDTSVLLSVSGCGVYKGVVRLNQTIQYSSARPCAAVFTAYTNTTKASASVRWASLTVGVNYTRLGTIRGLPVFPPRGFSAYALLGGVQVPARVEVIGDFDRLGRVSYNITVEYMGVVNRSVFVGYAAPPGSYTAANKTLGLLPPEARPYFQYLMERAAATGDWGLVDQISRLYTGAPTPMALLARYLVERDLAAGRGPNVAAAEALRQIEPLVLGIAGGLFLAFVRRFV
ncbi:hypothetical protein [Pyrobaculum ferrireducens]|uniref:hypothetical protein n=1 Tax=Pyrobaculum ferrireducens TaxID=1104324 RepID=UPI0011E50B32|nr:hypothetical protein [Pyrobaculum ferrireducens]